MKDSKSHPDSLVSHSTSAIYPVPETRLSLLRANYRVAKIRIPEAFTPKRVYRGWQTYRQSRVEIFSWNKIGRRYKEYGNN